MNSRIELVMYLTGWLVVGFVVSCYTWDLFVRRKRRVFYAEAEGADRVRCMLLWPLSYVSLDVFPFVSFFQSRGTYLILSTVFFLLRLVWNITVVLGVIVSELVSFVLSWKSKP